MLRGLTFPASGDAGDIYGPTTAKGSGYLDQGTGALIGWQINGPCARVEEWVYLLLTGKGAAVWGLILGMMVLAVPGLAVTGTLQWTIGRRGRRCLRGMVSAGRADAIILAGTEGGTTWGFAAALARGVQAAGHSVHLTPLSACAPSNYRSARQIVVMTATRGNGSAQSSAKGALDQLGAVAPLPSVPLTVLGFGDRIFPDFCAFATAFGDGAHTLGWARLLPTGLIGRRSTQAFARWR